LKRLAGCWNRKGQPRALFSCLIVTGTVMLTLITTAMGVTYAGRACSARLFKLTVEDFPRFG
jgi:hypothetical protein